MHETVVESAVTPAKELMSLISGAWVAQSIFVVAKLGIPDFIDQGTTSVTELAAATGADAPSLDRVMRALVSIGVFAAGSDRRFRLTPLSEQLRSNDPGSLRAYAIMNGEQWVWRSWGDIELSVRTGQPAFNHIFGSSLFDYYNAHPEAGAVSAAALNSLSGTENTAIVAAYDFPPSGTVIDVGGGQGSLLAAILRANPALRGVLLERPAVADKARTHFNAAGVADRCDVIAGDFFAELPKDGNVYLLKKVIHDWNDPQVRTILARCREAMPKTARLLLAESVIPEGHQTSASKWLDLLMLVYTGGRERTFAEYGDLLVSAGFKVPRIIATASNISVIEAIPDP